MRAICPRWFVAGSWRPTCARSHGRCTRTSVRGMAEPFGHRLDRLAGRIEAVGVAARFFSIAPVQLAITNGSDFWVCSVLAALIVLLNAHLALCMVVAFINETGCCGEAEDQEMEAGRKLATRTPGPTAAGISLTHHRVAVRAFGLGRGGGLVGGL